MYIPEFVCGLIVGAILGTIALFAIAMIANKNEE